MHSCTKEKQIDEIFNKLEKIVDKMDIIHTQINSNGQILTRLDKLENDVNSKSKINWIVIGALLISVINFVLPIILKNIFNVK